MSARTQLLGHVRVTLGMVEKSKLDTARVQPLGNLKAPSLDHRQLRGAVLW